MLVSQSRHSNHRSVHDARVTVTPQKSPVCMKYESLSVSKQSSIFHSVTRWLHATVLHFHVHTVSHCHHTVHLHIQTVALCHHIALYLPSHTVSLLSSPSFGYHKMFLLQTAAVRIILFAFACLDVCYQEKRSSDCQFIYHHPPHPRNDQTLLVSITIGLEKSVLRNTLLFSIKKKKRKKKDQIIIFLINLVIHHHCCHPCPLRLPQFHADHSLGQ